MHTSQLSDNGYTTSQKVVSQDSHTASDVSAAVRDPDHRTPTSLELHQQVHNALKTTAFRKDAAGKTGEDLKLAVAAAIASSRVLVEIVSVSLTETAESHPTSPYEALWITAPDATTEISYFDV